MLRFLAVFMLALYGLFVLLLFQRHASYTHCVNQSTFKSHYGYPYKSIMVCTFHPTRGDFVYSICQEAVFPKYIPPYCLLNQSLESPFRIVLAIIILLALVSLSCYPFLTHAVLFDL